MSLVLEICAYSIIDCIEAQCGGANRVELCEDMRTGGITPSYETVTGVRKHTNIPIHVMIRPRGGNFVYNEREIQIMLKSIRMAKHCGVSGLVFGCLTAAGDIDLTVCNRLMNEAQPLPVTFHRAFDKCRHPEQALEDIIKLGFARLLTSGQQPDAETGIPMLQQIVGQSANRIIIMPGSGINPDNIVKIARATGVNELHTSAQAVRGNGTDSATVAKCMEKIKRIKYKTLQKQNLLLQTQYQENNR
ncbi:MAG: copper homeostasis protein CutC [Prevotellaceae bacterium]|jgi:copper homeostasis protein|nr:copper homeostasis protein CutC [Prevotellaceae bacterium]